MARNVTPARQPHGASEQAQHDHSEKLQDTDPVLDELRAERQHHHDSYPCVARCSMPGRALGCHKLKNSERHRQDTRNQMQLLAHWCLRQCFGMKSEADECVRNLLQPLLQYQCVGTRDDANSQNHFGELDSAARAACLGMAHGI